MLQVWPNVVLFREAASDQVISWAPVINSQIQSGMTGELTCSSFHTLANRAAQWAGNQHRARLEIDCPKQQYYNRSGLKTLVSGPPDPVIQLFH